jgi:broad specificity phosphatase PhoE
MQGAASAAATIILIRHGDRFDHASKELWQIRCSQLGIQLSDPPLSSTGHAQARSTAAALASAGVQHILASPYLRAIQTAQPLAHAIGVSIGIEDGLSELGHIPDSIIPPAQRFAYFPEIDVSYASLHHVLAPERDSAFPLLYFRRILSLAEKLQQVYAGKTVACFTHAASLALVAALTGCSVAEAGSFAPCGIFKLERDDATSCWRVSQHGRDNSGHCSQSSAATHPWSFSHSFAPEIVEARWQEAKRLGPL